MPGHIAETTVTLAERDGKTFVTLRSLYQSKEEPAMKQKIITFL